MTEFETGHSPYQIFSYTRDSVHVVNAKHRASNALVGELVWTEPKGRVEGIQVHPDHKLNGVGTAMWAEAKRYASDNGVTEPKHAKDNQTDEGRAWAKKVGD
jgi:GNAT superfamily N-acetyltransferase